MGFSGGTLKATLRFKALGPKHFQILPSCFTINIYPFSQPYNFIYFGNIFQYISEVSQSHCTVISFLVYSNILKTLKDPSWHINIFKNNQVDRFLDEQGYQFPSRMVLMPSTPRTYGMHQMCSFHPTPRIHGISPRTNLIHTKRGLIYIVDKE